MEGHLLAADQDEGVIAGGRIAAEVSANRLIPLVFMRPLD